MKLMLFACALVSSCGAAPSSGQMTITEELATDGQVMIIEELASEGLVATTEELATEGLVATIEELATEGLVATTEELATEGLVATIEELATEGLVATTEELATEGLVATTEELATEGLVATTEELASECQFTTTEELASEGQFTTTEEAVSEGKLTKTVEPSVSPEYEISPFLKTITIVSTLPAVLIGALYSGILRCHQTDLNQCEVFQENYSGYIGLTAHMEYLYAANYSHILKCESTTKHSCETIYETSNVPVFSLAIGDGKIFAGLKNGTVLVSELHHGSELRTHHTFIGRKICSLKQMDGWLYVGLDNGHLMRCSTTEDTACTLRYNMKTYISGLVNISDTVLGVTWGGRLWNCSHKHETNRCVSVSLHFNRARDITVFNGDLYVLNYNDYIYKCKWGNDVICSKYAPTKDAFSMAFVYGTHLMQPRYINENKACTWQKHWKCPPYVVYYDTQQRAALQVHVKNGRLYNSEGALVDTRHADEGHYGPAAIFAMSPDGTILLSNRHIKEVIHVSSLFAGSPVSGAGEITVIRGVIQKMMACSNHYLPDLELNKQVIQSLSSQGYTKRILSVTCDDPDPDSYNNITCANY